MKRFSWTASSMCSLILRSQTWTPDPVETLPGCPMARQLPFWTTARFSFNHFLSPFSIKTPPNFGLFPPPEADPYLAFNIEIPLGGDINQNGEDDKIKFTLIRNSVLDENREFLPLRDGAVDNHFDSAAILEGAIVDLSSDPPFTIGALLPNGLPDYDAFGGPTTATSNLENSIVPVPPTVLLLASGLIGLAGFRRKFLTR